MRLRTVASRVLPAVIQLSALAALPLAAGCAHGGGASAPARGPAAADYFPLAVGNTWTWIDQSPGLPAGAAPPERTVRILERTPDGYLRDSERGELKAGPECVQDRLRRLLCAPIEVGRTWSSVVSVSSTERYEIAGVGESVATPAGRFDGCVRVRAHNRVSATTDHVNEITYAPGVGPVRIETFAVVNGKVSPQVRAVLRSYRIEGR